MSFFCFCISISILFKHIDATSYYFSTSGDDSNSGTSSSSAWRSLSKAANLDLQPGDNVLLRANDTFTSPLLINNAYGTSANPITISSYELQTQYNRARITLKSNTNPNINTSLACINCDGIVISDLELDNAQYAGIELFYSGSRKKELDYILIENNYFHNINAQGPNNTGSWWAAAITLDTTDKGISLTNYIIKHNLCNESDIFNKHQNVNILSGSMNGNLLTHNYYNVVKLSIVKHFIIENNVFLNNTPITSFIYGTTDIIIGTIDNTSSVINNEFGYRGEYPTAPDGCSIDFETNANGTLVKDNYIYNSFGAGIMVYGHPPNALSENLNIDNNIFIEDGCIQKHGDHGAIAFLRNDTSGVVMNNYFVRCSNQSVAIFNTNGQNQNLDDWKFINNTIVNDTKQIVDKPIIYFNKQNNTGYNGQQKVVFVSAECGKNVAPDCDIRYTIDGSKPFRNSTKYIIGEKIMVESTSGVLFKSFAQGMIESASVGLILNPEL